ncbi:hypothetical protein D6D01_09735 [Aureobasidium pullulans]|uniref:FAD-binding domain-containing protein n=1 Tax=Aureobasidium pullulans TaxID=5580 RepID=A0A4V4JQW3_AURPU|nr:hypothetical protein D6D01_09735 [Aureobasidium pullulans]
MSVFGHWPQMEKEIEEEQYDADNYEAKMYGSALPEFNDLEKAEAIDAATARKGPHVGFMQGRVKFFNMLLRQIKRCGIQIQWGKRITEYYEKEEAGVGGTVLENCEHLEADIIVAAERIKTTSVQLLTGYSPEPKDSGQSMYRTGYAPDFTKHDPAVLEHWPVKPGDKPEWQFWLSNGLHLSAMISSDMVVWGLTHEDEYGNDCDETYDWQPNADPNLVHWELRWRDLNRQWTSDGGRIVQVGDSAHPFLPASGNGATQALEDAVSLAKCLQLAGRSNAAVATKVHNRLRYERFSCAQMMSFVNTQQHHFTDWTMIAVNP